MRDRHAGSRTHAGVVERRRLLRLTCSTFLGHARPPAWLAEVDRRSLDRRPGSRTLSRVGGRRRRPAGPREGDPQLLRPDCTSRCFRRLEFDAADQERRIVQAHRTPGGRPPHEARGTAAPVGRPGEPGRTGLVRPGAVDAREPGRNQRPDPANLGARAKEVREEDVRLGPQVRGSREAVPDRRAPGRQAPHTRSQARGRRLLEPAVLPAPLRGPRQVRGSRCEARGQGQPGQPVRRRLRQGPAPFLRPRRTADAGAPPDPRHRAAPRKLRRVGLGCRHRADGRQHFRQHGRRTGHAPGFAGGRAVRRDARRRERILRRRAWRRRRRRRHRRRRRGWRRGR